MASRSSTLVLATALCLAGACKKESSSQTRAGPYIGYAELSFSGALEHNVKGSGVQIADDGEARIVSSLDVQATKRSPYWLLVVDVTDGEPWARLQVGEIKKSLDDQKAFERASGPITVDKSGNYTLDVVMRAGDGSEIRVAGTVRSPRWPGRTKQHAKVLAKLEKAGFSAREFAYVGSDEAKDSALVSVVVRADEARATRTRVRDSLIPGWTAFVGEDEPSKRAASNYDTRPVQIVCAPVDSQYDVVPWARTAPPNDVFGAATVITKLKSWARENPLDIIEARHDSVTAKLRTPPADVTALAREVHEFAPEIAPYLVEDTISGEELRRLAQTDHAKLEALYVDAVAARIRRYGEITLWWD